jgi:hypothetical protein
MSKPYSYPPHHALKPGIAAAVALMSMLCCIWELFVQGSTDEDFIDDNLGFSKDRCISRLTEMQSYEYLIAHAKKHSPQLLLALQEAAPEDGKLVAEM